MFSDATRDFLQLDYLLILNSILKVGESNEENYDGRDRSNEFIGDTNSYYVSSSSDEELNENSQRYLTESIPGEPNTDYPTYKSIPKTAFSCKGKPNWGYYADVETGCQVKLIKLRSIN